MKNVKAVVQVVFAVVMLAVGGSAFAGPYVSADYGGWKSRGAVFVGIESSGYFAEFGGVSFGDNEVSSYNDNKDYDYFHSESHEKGNSVVALIGKSFVLSGPFSARVSVGAHKYNIDVTDTTRHLVFDPIRLFQTVDKQSTTHKRKGVSGVAQIGLSANVTDKTSIVVKATKYGAIDRTALSAGIQFRF